MKPNLTNPCGGGVLHGSRVYPSEIGTRSGLALVGSLSQKKKKKKKSCKPQDVVFHCWYGCAPLHFIIDTKLFTKKKKKVSLLVLANEKDLTFRKFPV
jgi:hypothetical protein